jgi:hypothetical protein
MGLVVMTNTITWLVLFHDESCWLNIFVYDLPDMQKENTYDS